MMDEIVVDLVDGYGYTLKEARKWAEENGSNIVDAMWSEYGKYIRENTDNEDSNEEYVIVKEDCEDEPASEQRVIEYAEHRLEANPEDRRNFSFDTYKMDISEARFVIEIYGEAARERKNDV